MTLTTPSLQRDRALSSSVEVVSVWSDLDPTDKRFCITYALDPTKMTQSIQMSSAALPRIAVAADHVIDMRAAMAPTVDRQAAPVPADRSRSAVPVDRSPPPLPASTPRTSRSCGELSLRIGIPLAFGVGIALAAGFLGKDKTDEYGDTVFSAANFTKWFFIVGTPVTAVALAASYWVKDMVYSNPSSDWNLNHWNNANAVMNGSAALSRF